MSYGECSGCDELLVNGEGLCEECASRATENVRAAARETILTMQERINVLEAERKELAGVLYHATLAPDWGGVDDVRWKLDPQHGGSEEPCR